MATTDGHNAAVGTWSKRFVFGLTVAVTGTAGAWLIGGGTPSHSMVDRSNVVSAAVAVVGIPILIYGLWSLWRKKDAAWEIPEEQLQAASDYLATETLRYWAAEARTRGILAPIPAAVRWRWADSDVGAPADEISAPTMSFTQGTVSTIGTDLYDQLPAANPRIVIIGDAGSGKTGALLLLMLDVLQRRTDKRAGTAVPVPVPVWLTLGSWNPRTKVLDWVATQMTRDYPGIASADYPGKVVAQELLRRGRIALFLDGLDEMPEASRSRALSQLDNLSGIPTVLTSRPTEFRNAVHTSRLFGAAVVQTRPVELSDASDFLMREQLAARRERWALVVHHINDNPEGVAGRTFTTPLALSLARDSYMTQGDPAELVDEARHPTPEDLLTFLLSRVFHLAYPDSRERARAITWLSWIAKRMGSQRDLAWWRLSSIPGQWKTPRRLLSIEEVREGASTAPNSDDEKPQRRPLSRQEVSVFRIRLASVVIALVLATFAARLMQLQFFAAEKFEAKFNGDPVPGPSLASTIAILFFAIAAGFAVGRLATWLLNDLGRGNHYLPATTPLESYRADRLFQQRSLMACLIPFLLLALWDLPVAIAFAASTAAALALGPATALRLLEVGLLLRHRGRIRFIPLLAEASQRQILRQVGPTYQFRHAALQEFLQRPRP